MNWREGRLPQSSLLCPRFLLPCLKTCSLQSPSTPTIPYVYDCQASIDVRVSGYNVLGSEGRMQSNTNKLCDSLHLSSEYLAKLQPRTSPRGTRWPLGHRSEETCALHRQQWRHIRLMKIGTNTTLYFNCIVRQDLCWATPPVQVLALPPDNWVSLNFISGQR